MLLCRFILNVERFGGLRLRSLGRLSCHWYFTNKSAIYLLSVENPEEAMKGGPMPVWGAINGQHANIVGPFSDERCCISESERNKKDRTEVGV